MFELIFLLFGRLLNSTKHARNKWLEWKLSASSINVILSCHLLSILLPSLSSAVWMISHLGHKRHNKVTILTYFTLFALIAFLLLFAFHFFIRNSIEHVLATTAHKVIFIKLVYIKTFSVDSHVIAHLADACFVFIINSHFTYEALILLFLRLEMLVRNLHRWWLTSNLVKLLLAIWTGVLTLQPPVFDAL